MQMVIKLKKYRVVFLNYLLICRQYVWPVKLGECKEVGDLVEFQQAVRQSKALLKCREK